MHQNVRPISSSVRAMPPEVLDDIVAVRDTGAVDMFDVHRVAAALDALGMHASAAWIEHNLAAYMATVLFGTGDDASSR